MGNESESIRVITCRRPAAAAVARRPRRPSGRPLGSRVDRAPSRPLRSGGPTHAARGGDLALSDVRYRNRMARRSLGSDDRLDVPVPRHARASRPRLRRPGGRLREPLRPRPRTAVNARLGSTPAGAVLLFGDERVLSSDEDHGSVGSGGRRGRGVQPTARQGIREGYAAKVRDCVDQGGGLVPLGFRRSEGRKLLDPSPRGCPTPSQCGSSPLRDCRTRLSPRRPARRSGSSAGCFVRRYMAGGSVMAVRRYSPRQSTPDDRSRPCLRADRTRAGNWLRRNRTYALTGGGPLVCARCGQPVKGDTRIRRTGEKVAVYRHRDGMACPGWPVRRVPTNVLDGQVDALLAARHRTARAQHAFVSHSRDRSSGPIGWRSRGWTPSSRSSEPRSLIRDRVATGLRSSRRSRRHVASVNVSPPCLGMKGSSNGSSDRVAGSLAKLWRETSDQGRATWRWGSSSGSRSSRAMTMARTAS